MKAVELDGIFTNYSGSFLIFSEPCVGGKILHRHTECFIFHYFYGQKFSKIDCNESF